MALLDQFGNPYAYQWKVAHSSNQYSGDRPWQPVILKDIDKLVPAVDRKTLVSASYRLYLNDGVFRSAIQQKAIYSVGRAWLPRFEGNDTAWGKVATAWLTEQWYGNCDVMGQQLDFQSGMWLDCTQMDLAGEAYILLTRSEDGKGTWPMLQRIPGHRITSAKYNDGETLREGPYVGLKIKDGIVYNKQSRPVAVCYCDEDGNFDRWLSYRDLIPLYDHEWANQGRGLPAFTHALNDFRDALQSHDWERAAQLLLSSIGMVEYNELGGPDPSDNTAALLNTGTPGGPMEVTRNIGGMNVHYFKAGNGGKIETIKNDRPGEMWESFQDRIYRKGVGPVWPYALCWKPTGQGTAERGELAKAQRMVEDRQDDLRKSAKRQIGYAISVAIKEGFIPFNQEWYKWGFTYPRSITIDDGRAFKELQGLWQMGAINMDDIISMRGDDPDTHYDRRAEEIAKRKLAAQRVMAKYPGIEIDDAEMSMLNPNQMLDKGENQTNQDDGKSTDN